MGGINIIIIAVIATTAVFSFKGFNNQIFFDRYKFNVAAILRVKQWDRMLTSAFLHGDLMHLIFNMFTFYFFATNILVLGTGFFFLVYFGSILGGNFLALWMHRRNPYYSAIGASGGVSGILFAAIILDSSMRLIIFPIPIPIAGWIFGILYLGYSVYGMRSQLGNIGHDAHLGGAVIGIICAMGYIFLNPDNPYIHFEVKYLLIMLIPLAFLVYLAYKEK